MARLQDASLLWTPDGWQAAPVAPGSVGAGLDDSGWRVPGISNLHSHAFQRAMAGLAERSDGDGDSFWSWRRAMYRVAARFDPDSLQAVAAQLYVEMLEAGYTSVCEFHYLHHAPDGLAYADPSAMSQALIQAARETGIRLTLLPVLYMCGGFDLRPLSIEQIRFGHDVDAFLRLLQGLQGQQDQHLCVGVAFHSLRAVPAHAMHRVLDNLPADTPVHIHAAEQVEEVRACLRALGARPVEWLLANLPVNPRWTLIHATQLTARETSALARSGATVALCPTTEANLGDGLFPLRDYLEAHGAWGIGSDSQISVSPVEELRLLEYGQRLQARRRNIVVPSRGGSVGEALLGGVHASAAQATGLRQGQDWIVLERQSPAFAGATMDDVSDRWLFAGNRPLVSEVHVAGRCVVSGGQHYARELIERRFKQAMESLLAA